MQKSVYFILILSLQFYIFNSSLKSQKLSKNAQISLITCSPGEMVHSYFGHSAMRIKDTIKNIDVIYNYGAFNFKTPNFYLKFVTGKLKYRLASYDFYRFKKYYIKKNRGIYEQILNIDNNHLQNIYDFLKVNYLPQNREYLYDFYYDNCSSRIRDVIEGEFKEQISFDSSFVVIQPSFRRMINEYTKKSKWLQTGMNLIQGLPSDEILYYREFAFLPDYLAEIFDNAKIDNNDTIMNLVKKRNIIFEHTSVENDSLFIFSPNFVLWFIFIISFGLTIFQLYKRKRNYLFDKIYFFVIGLIGLIITFLIFFTAHKAMHQNLNIIWANPITFLLSISIIFTRFHKLIKYAFLINGIICLIFVLTLPLNPQDILIVFIPLILTISIRSAYLYVSILE